MPLILAIEPDSRQAARVSALAPAFLDAEIQVVNSVREALEVLGASKPDLVLTPLLLSTKDDAALTARLREMETDGAELQTLVIPVLASGEPQQPVQEKPGGLLTRLRRTKAVATAGEGCAPSVFAAQITEYLSRMAAERHDREEATRAREWTAPPSAASAPMLDEWLTVRMAPPIPYEEVGSEDPTLRTMASDLVPIDDVRDVDDVRRVGSSDPTTDDAVRSIASSDPTTDDAVRSSASSEPTTNDAVRSVGSSDPTTIEDDQPQPQPTPLAAAAPAEELVVQQVADDTEPEDTAVEATWEDLQSFLEDLEIEQAHPPADLLVANDESEPNVIELPSPDELWSSLDGHQEAIAPLEGPTMKKRRAAPTKTPKAARGKTAEAQPGAVRRPRRPKAPDKPMQDEWGLYDPEQCGFAALLERLQEMTDAETTEKERPRRSVIMRR